MICNQCGLDYPATKRRHRLCIACKRAYDKAWRIKRRQQGLKTGGTKMPPEYHAQYQERYYKIPEKRRMRAVRASLRRESPSEAPKIKARMEVRNAIRRGDLNRQPCEVCGSSHVQAHHDDYSKPLDVRWLCRTHHRAVHAKAEAGQ